MSSTDRAWQKWGSTAPYYGVLSDERFRDSEAEGVKDEFFATGRAYVAQRMDVIDNTLGLCQHRRALDFGCGVGRLAISFAPHFAEVVGVDISQDMLDEAAANAARFGEQNVKLVLSDATLSRVSGKFDLVHSYIVLQHIDVTRGVRLIDRLLDLVAEGGVASLHLSIARTGAPLREGLYWFRKNVPGVEQAVSILRRGSTNGPVMQMNSYPLDTVFSLFRGYGFGPLTVHVEPHGNRTTLHLAARKGG